MEKMKLLLREKRFHVLAALFVLILVGTNMAAFHLGASKCAPPAPVPEEQDFAVPASLEQEWDIFREVLAKLQESYLYPLDLSAVVRGAVRGAVEAVGDSRTVFYDAAEMKNFLIQANGSFGGIGVRIIEVDGEIVVFETIPDSPAADAGLLPGDRICNAGGRELLGLGLEGAADILRGEKGSTVELLIRRPGREDELDITLVRDEVKPETVFAHMEEPGVGYLRISNFDSDTGISFSEKLQFLEKRGLNKGLILDLRDNPGGQLEEAIKVAELIVPEGEVTRLVGQKEEVRNIYHSAAPEKSYPIVVLVNEDTASAAEILAGALQDRKAALLVGLQTYGKATVQRLENLSKGNGLLVTVAHYLTPDGKDINGVGLEPDFVVEMPPLMRYYRYFFPGPLAGGDYGPQVQLLQEMLKELGYEPGREGYYDGDTAAALSSFQKAAGLKANGIFDELTWLQLREDFEIVARESDPQLLRAMELIKQSSIWLELRGGSG